ncbi:MAG: alpha-glucuronidase [Muribaculaceae bacterium]|nr:alpha-glucuronidase [Muribaculaceae bacterium]
MKTFGRFYSGLFASAVIITYASLPLFAERSDSRLWLPLADDNVSVEYNGNEPIALKAVEILSEAAPDSYFRKIRLVENKKAAAKKEAYVISADSTTNTVTVSAPTAQGLLYGALSLYRPASCFDRTDAPKHDLRVLNHWDNLDGTIERGYAGQSIWNWDSPLTDQQISLYKKYALANAMAGINGTVLNNVNASPNMLTPQILKRVAEIADILRPYGIKVYLSVNFASPSVIGGLSTADPLDKDVAKWWQAKAKEIYSLIPDFGGFLVKANSEGQPGPCDFGRTHAEGANMLAKALKPYGGLVMWRAFVYSPSDPDRAKQAYVEFNPLDGKFDSNVMVQVKNGPVDFQPREPYSPLFNGMKKTPLIAELQITQEYLGHANHLAYLAPMWEEFFDEAPGGNIKGVAGVANIGNNENMTGHPLAQANWYAFGRLAWDPTLKSDDIVEEWAEMTPWLNIDDSRMPEFKKMMAGSRENVVDYMMPMGLHHLFAFGHHYGPQPWCDPAGARPDWLPKYYHRADRDGIGFDRTVKSGSGATAQYPSPLAETLEDVNACPEKYLLWFHHLGWDHQLPSGETLWEALNRHYDQGVEGVADMRMTWNDLDGTMEPEIYNDIKDRLLTQHKDAIWWRDACLEYFGEKAGKKPTGLSMHSLEEMIPVELGIDNYTNPSPSLLDSKR